MADSFGAVRVPLVAPATGEAVGDPMLTVLLAFLKAFLQTDGGATAAWNASGIAPTLPVVKTVNANDPSKTDQVFNTNDLGALYLWRAGGGDGSKFEWMAEDWRVEETKLKLLWIPPMVKREISNVRNNIFNGIAKAIDIAIERGRTPSYRIAGDPDPAAATQGSVFYDAAGLMFIELSGQKDAEITVINTDGSRGHVYSALEMTITIQEKVDYDLTRYTPDTATEVTLTTPTGFVVEHEILTP